MTQRTAFLYFLLSVLAALREFAFRISGVDQGLLPYLRAWLFSTPAVARVGKAQRAHAGYLKARLFSTAATVSTTTHHSTTAVPRRTPQRRC